MGSACMSDQLDSVMETQPGQTGSAQSCSGAKSRLTCVEGAQGHGLQQRGDKRPIDLCRSPSANAVGQGVAGALAEGEDEGGGDEEEDRLDFAQDEEDDDETDGRV